MKRRTASTVWQSWAAVLALLLMTASTVRAQGRPLVNTEVEFAQGELAYTQQNYPLALQRFKALVTSDPQNARAHYWLGATYIGMGEKELARQEFKKVIDIGEPQDFVDKSQRYLQALEGKGTAPKWYEVNLATGYRYDSNLFLDPDAFNLIRNQDSSAWDAYVHAAVYPVRQEHFLLGAEYSFFNALYFSHDDFSFTWHRAGLIMIPKFGAISLPFRPNFTATFVDHGGDFYQMAGNFPVAVRADYGIGATELSYRFKIEKFDNVNTADFSIFNAFLRDNRSHYVGLDQYFKFFEQRIQMNVGGFLAFENARTPYDVRGPEVHGRLALLLPLGFLADGSVSHYWKFYYNDLKPDVGFTPNFIAREDKVLTVSASLKHAIWGPLWASAGYEYLLNNSNEAVFHYQKHTVTAYLGVDF